MSDNSILWLVVVTIILMIFISGCATKEPIPRKTPVQVLEKITLNVCQTDSENADYWRNNKVNLFSKAGGLAAGATKVGELPSCLSLNLDVLQKQTVGGVEFYKVRYSSLQGWQTKRLLVG